MLVEEPTVMQTRMTRDLPTWAYERLKDDEYIINDLSHALELWLRGVELSKDRKILHIRLIALADKTMKRERPKEELERLKRIVLEEKK